MSPTPDANSQKLLPDGQSATVDTDVVQTSAPSRQLSELPKDELENLAEEFGLDAHAYQSRQHLVAAIHERRQLIASMDREAMLDVVKWGRRPVTANATREQLAVEIVRIKSMRFGGLSQAGLKVLGYLRGVDVHDTDDVPLLIRRLKRKEGFFTRLNRKRRSLIGSAVSRILGEADTAAYQFLPGQGEDPPDPASAPGRSASIKEEIEEAGLFGGITSRIKRSADQYLNQKLDEIEARIDRKLDEIDRRLADWRDKEVANRIRILKITLWASVIVAALSLIYSYINVYFVRR